MFYCKPEALSLERAKLDFFLKVSHAFQSRKNSSKEFQQVEEEEGRKDDFLVNDRRVEI